jgi:hypothetical protein
MTLHVRWIDRGREPKCAPNPRFPKGVDVDVSRGAAQCCHKMLPYPAKRCGAYIVECSECGVSVGITTAGRVDDPRSVRVACARKEDLVQESVGVGAGVVRSSH